MLYDAIQVEAKNPTTKTVQQKLKRTRNAVFRVAKAYAKANKLYYPNMREIEAIEKAALRYLDFQVKYSIYVAACMRKIER